MKAQRGSRGNSYSLFKSRRWMGVDGQCQVPAATPLPPREREPVPILQEAGRAPGPVWKCVENLDPQTVQPVVSRYNDYAIPAHRVRAIKIH
jgi:hypothetical protein